MQPRHEVTIHLTKEQYEELVHEAAHWTLDLSIREAIEAATFDPLLDERVTVGSSFKRGQG